MTAAARARTLENAGNIPFDADLNKSICLVAATFVFQS